MKPLRIAVTADLHYGGARGRGDEATRLLAAFLYDQPPDVLILAGDIGHVEHFDQCLTLFDNLSVIKALVPGNHDVWVERDDSRGDSLTVYREHLPRVCAAHGFHYLDGGPLFLPDSGLALVGTMNWYDYSWSIDQLRDQLPDYEKHLLEMRFPAGGRHNDRRFVRWSFDDVGFTAEVVATFRRHLGTALAQVDRAVVIAHHPPFFGLNFPNETETSPSVDRLLWEAFSGNRALEELLTQHGDRIPFIFCGHTHRARENRLGPSRGYNVGGDYGWKRLLLLDWPAGTVEAHSFGEQGEV